MLSDKAITDYQAIYKKEFGKEISKEEAQIQAEKFLHLFSKIYKPLSKKEINKYFEIMNK